MASIIKVDTIQTAAGGTPTAADLGLNTTGSVLQVVSSNNGYAVTTSSSYVDTGLQQTITPIATNSKFLITCNFASQAEQQYNASWHIGLFHSADSYASVLVMQAGHVASTTWLQLPCALQHLHSPGLSAGTAITYKLKFKMVSGGNTIYLNDNWSGSDNRQTISVVEIAG